MVCKLTRQCARTTQLPNLALFLSFHLRACSSLTRLDESTLSKCCLLAFFCRRPAFTRRGPAPRHSLVVHLFILAPKSYPTRGAARLPARLTSGREMRVTDLH